MQQKSEMDIIQDLLSEDRETLIYRPSLRSVGISVLGTILLSQMLFWNKDVKRKNKTEFYKFIQPCDHVLYKEGDSWCEELNITPIEFTTARNQFSEKVTAKNATDPSIANALVTYRITTDRVTYWKVNNFNLQQRLLFEYRHLHPPA